MSPELASAWRRALRAWGLGVDLSAPVALAQGEELACIDLRTRQTRVNLRRLEALGARGHLEALLAHEAGHHCRYPQTLGAAAKLLARQRALLAELECGRPGLPRVGPGFQAERLDCLLNLLLDVLINDALRVEHGPSYQALYRAILAEAPAGPGPRPPPSAMFGFTLALYEALWSADILGPAERARLAEVAPGWREEAGALAAALGAAGGNMYLALDLYLEAVWPYAVADWSAGRLPAAGWLERVLVIGPGDLDLDDLVGLARRSPEEQEADRQRAERRHPTLVELPPDPPAEPPARGLRRELGAALAAGRAFGQDPRALSALVLEAYAREAERYRLRPPLAPGADALTPTTLAPWELGEEPARVDWLASLGRAGVAIPGLTLLEREYEAGQAQGPAEAPPWLEVYIDSSGSMPDPSRDWSELAFAGFLLSRAALEAGSRVRLVQFSGPGNVRAMPDFSADRRAVERALLEHLGGGTQFPFDELGRSLDRFRPLGRVQRVLLSDSDFLHNVLAARPAAAALGPLARAATPPSSFTAILNLPALPAGLPAGLAGTGLELVAIPDWNALQGVTTALGRRLFQP
ncbi:MAG TPA: VWA domain-containing protein [Myxococcota bacterium]|nr:VWA domain-containing protein [Myxococcota bacterium]HRY93020.1 VWA domain-containing protein [Myxococcota bacterium]HSA20247.1 VWA domain-containing protein [Myxococcota bacterium]